MYISTSYMSLHYISINHAKVSYIDQISRYQRDIRPKEIINGCLV